MPIVDLVGIVCSKSDTALKTGYSGYKSRFSRTAIPKGMVNFLKIDCETQGESTSSLTLKRFI